MKKVLFLMVSSLMMVFFNSCESESDMMLNSVEMSEITYIFDIPEEAYMYYSIDGFHNATQDAAHDIVIDSEYTVKYNSKKVNQDCLVVLDCTRTNRPLDRDFMMYITVSIKSYMTDGTVKENVKISQVNINELKQFTDKVKRGTWNVKVNGDGESTYSEYIK